MTNIELLSNYKKQFNKFNFSLVYSVENNARMNIIITDKQEKKAYCGISTKNIDFVKSFLRKNLKKLAWHFILCQVYYN